MRTFAYRCRCIHVCIHLCVCVHLVCAMIHSDVCHDPLINVSVLLKLGVSVYIYCVTWRIQMCAMTHSDECHDSFRCVPWPIYKRVCPLETGFSLVYIHMCVCVHLLRDMAHSNVCHDSFRCVPWLIRMYVRARLDMCRDLFRKASLLLRTSVSVHICLYMYLHKCISWLI